MKYLALVAYAARAASLFERFYVETGGLCFRISYLSYLTVSYGKSSSVMCHNIARTAFV